MDYTKMMATLAVAATATVAMADVVSSSVVGYQNKGFDNAQYNITAATFVPVSGDKDAMTLGDFVPNEDFVSSAITFMTPGGATPRVAFGGKQVAARYVYWTAEDGAEDGAGWYLEADEDATVNQNAVNVPFGNGILLYRDGSEANAELTYSGAVNTEPVTRGFTTAQYNICGNCSPVDITLGDITVNNEFVSSAITFMTQGGATPRVDFGGKQVAARYVYWTAEDGAEDGAGWYLEADEDATVNQNSLPIAAGQGFLVYRDGSESKATITIPSAL